MSSTAIFLWVTIPIIIAFFSIISFIVFGIDSDDAKEFFNDTYNRFVDKFKFISKKKKQKYLKQYIQLIREESIALNKHIYKSSENESAEEKWNKENLERETRNFAKDPHNSIRYTKKIQKKAQHYQKMDKQVQENLDYLYKNDLSAVQSKIKELESEFNLNNDLIYESNYSTT